MTEPELHVGLWADDYGDRYPVGPFGSGLCLGSYTLTVDDLMRMRPWVNGQTSWPQYAIQSRWDNFEDDEFEYENEAELANWPEERQRAMLTRLLTDWVRHVEADPADVLDELCSEVNDRLPEWAVVFENGEGMWGDCRELFLAEGHTFEELEAWLSAEAGSTT